MGAGRPGQYTCGLGAAVSTRWQLAAPARAEIAEGPCLGGRDSPDGVERRCQAREERIDDVHVAYTGRAACRRAGRQVHGVPAAGP